MNHQIRARLAAIVCAAGLLECHAAQFVIGAHNFTLPDGFEIEKVTTTNVVQRPVEADFDEQGRLYVTESSGTNDKVQKQLEDKPHRVVRLEDADGDGRFDKSIVFADKLSFLEGAMFFGGSLYVSAPPSIWKLTDTNDDGIADERVEWFQGKTLTGCANDLHGPYAGRDGWIYWCKGAFAKQTYALPNGKEFTTRASHIFRSRPDGNGIEPVMTGGMDNPVGLCILPTGERILSGTFFQHPEAGKRDGLIHALYGGVYGKIHDVIDDHIKTGELLPIMTHLGPAAPAGLMCYESDALGADFKGNLFAACFNLRKVTRHLLKPMGATFATIDSDFLASDNPDFHPTDVFEDADGSLLVIDTGGWYKLCCPTSQLYKPDVVGGIYRVRRSGAPRVNDPRGLKLKWNGATAEELASRLGDPRPAVRAKAMQQLVKTEGAVTALRKALEDDQRALGAVWALSRIDSAAARSAVRSALGSSVESVKTAAAHAASVWRDKDSAPVLAAATGSLQFKRVAAEALGRIGNASAIKPLLAMTEGADRALDHSIIFALIELNDSTATRDALRADSSAAARRAALVALDQLQQARADDVVPLLTSTNPLLKATASWIVEHHSEWGDTLAQFFTQQFKSNPGKEQIDELRRQLPPLMRNTAIQLAVAELLHPGAVSKEARVALLQAVARSGLKEMPGGWAREISACLRGGDDDLAREAVAAARSVPIKSKPEARAALLALGTDRARPIETRLGALAAAEELPEEAFAFVLESAGPKQPLLVRSTAAGIIARSTLKPEQLVALLPALKFATPMELPKLLAAYSRSHDGELGAKLVRTLKEAAALHSLRPEMIAGALTNFPAAVKQQAQPVVASLNADAEREHQQIENMLGSLKNGDIRRGQALFNSDKTACSSCHAIGYVGGNVGPDLTRIGQIRTERDLLEAVVYPSASFVRSYEPVLVATKDGEEYSGVLRKDAPDEVVLATGPSTEQRIARSDITDMRPGSVSVMPSGLAEQLSKEELADLVAFLRATRW